MAGKLILDRPILVEGKYDKIRLSSIVESEILTTDGFGIFKANEKRDMLKRIAAKNGMIVLTDSDGGGLVIRNHIRNILSGDNIVHLYIPQIKGRERRKSEDSKEGLLGVEGMDNELLIKLLKPFEIGCDDVKKEKRRLTSAELYSFGYAGGEGSSEKRKKLCARLGLPDNVSTSAMLEAMNLLYGYDECIEMLSFKQEEL